jgi:ubiquinone/menaquinone biosynthesis C-methylase UbiE
MTSNPSSLKERLEQIADVHLNHDPASVVDAKVLVYDMVKMMHHVRGPEVLEMGVGDGMWTEALIERFGHTHIVDASRKLLDATRVRHGNAAIVFESFFEVFSPPDICFSTIIATHILEHVEDPVLVLRRARNWLAPGGRILIIVPNATSLHRQLAVLMGIQPSIYSFSPRDHQVGHVRVYDLPKLRSDIAEAGFRVLEERGMFLKILPNHMMTHFSDELLKALVDISDGLPAEMMANLALVAEPVGAE